MKVSGWWGLWLAIGTGYAQEWESRALPGFPLQQESAHFCFYWNDSTLLSRTAADSALHDLELWWDFQITQGRFPEPQPGRTPRIRTSVFLLDKGWAQGGMDGGTPALWFSRPALKDPWALGHEFAQSLQSASGGFQGSPYAGWVWASHANWMTHQRMDTVAGCTELYRRQTQIHFGSTRNRFCNWTFLEFLKDRYGQDALQGLWTRWPGKRAAKDQDFLGMLQEDLSLDNESLADLWRDFSLRMARADFQRGATYRKAWESDRSEEWQRLDQVELDLIDSANARWAIPFEMAPQAFGFNVTQLHELRDTVKVRLQPVLQGSRPAWTPRLRLDPDTIPEPTGEWRWGIAVVDTGFASAFRFRYILPETGNDGLSFRPSATEKAYLVVTATPRQRPLIQWDQSHRSLYRYPWMTEIHGARPEGWQVQRLAPPSVAGAPHPNGGGFVAATATVDSSAWIGPHAMVLEYASVLGNARIEDYAVVKGTAMVRDQATVSDRARVWGDAQVLDQATISGHAVATRGIFQDSCRVDGFATANVRGTVLSGKARLGGTATTFAPAQLSGHAQVAGDAELWKVSASTGSYTGLVDPSTISDPSLGAGLATSLPEVTSQLPLVWSEGQTKIARQDARRSLRIARRGDLLVLSGLPEDVESIGIHDLQGRQISRARVGTTGQSELNAPRGLFLVILHRPDGQLSARMVLP